VRFLVFPGDPLKKYYAKGEVKERYWNPKNIFDEVHVISLCDDDIEPERVRDFAGKAQLFIHPIGRPNMRNYWRIRQRALACCKHIKPDLHRFDRLFEQLVQGDHSPQHTRVRPLQ